MKYAIEVWKCGSISKAAEHLFLDQANLSRTIRQLENEYRIQLFQRTSSGVEITSDGLLFLREAEKLVGTVESFDHTFKLVQNDQLACKIAVADVTYFSDAFSAAVAEQKDAEELEITYYETNDMLDIINRVSNSGYHLGVIRCTEEYESAYQKLLNDKQLDSQRIMAFQPTVIMNKEHPLANRKSVSVEELYNYVCILRGDDPEQPILNSAIGKGDTNPENHVPKLIYIYGRGSQYDVLRNIHDSCMIVPKLSDSIIKRNHLVQLELERVQNRTMIDLLIMRRGYHPTRFERTFIDNLKKEAHNSLGI